MIFAVRIFCDFFFTFSVYVGKKIGYRKAVGNALIREFISKDF